MDIDQQTVVEALVFSAGRTYLKTGKFVPTAKEVMMDIASAVLANMAGPKVRQYLPQALLDNEKLHRVANLFLATGVVDMATGTPMMKAFGVNNAIASVAGVYAGDYANDMIPAGNALDSKASPSAKAKALHQGRVGLAMRNPATPEGV